MTLETEQEVTAIQEPVTEGVIGDVVTEGPKVEKTFNAKTVSAIVAREREKAFEKGKHEAMMEIQQQAQPEAQAPVQQQQGQTTLGGMQSLSPDDVMRIMQERMPSMMEQHVQSAKQEQVINSFVNKMRAAEEKYPGLERELSEINWTDPRTSALAIMTNDLDNSGDVMKELLDHPSKFGDLLNLVDSQPNLAAKQLYSLSNSIKQNEKAQAENKRAQEPISQMKPSLNAGMDDGTASVADFRKMQW